MTIPQFPKGWKVHPCHPGTKRPILDNWPALATDDSAQIEKWFHDFPNCNWALAVGPSGLAVLDPDGQVGEDSLTLFEIEHGELPATRVHATPRGGRHLIFRDEFLTVQNSVGKLGPKLDTRGQNGYIIIPPSTFEGKPYVVLDDREAADVPDHVARLAGIRREAVGAAAGTELDDAGAVGRAGRLLRDYVERGDIARQGAGGDDRTYSLCAEVLNFGLTPDKAQELIEEIWNPHCVPPWDSDELRVKIENASRYAQNEAGAWAVPPVTERIEADVLDRLIASAPSVQEASASRFAWMDESEFKTMPPPAWLIEDMLIERGLSMIFGPSGHFKSFIAMGLGCEVAARGKCVFYVAGEGIARMARKDYPAWKHLHGETRDLPFYLQEDMPLYLDGDASDYRAFGESIAAKAAGRPVGLIVFDTTNRAMLGLDENSAKDVAKFLAAGEELKKAFGCNVMLIHHTPEADTHKARGSSAIFGGLDTVLRVDADKEAKLVKLWVQKQKNAEERNVPFCYRGEKVGEGLAFVQIEAKEMTAIEHQAELFDLKTIFAALTKMSAHAPGVSSRALVMELTPRRPEDTDEAYNAMMSERMRVLSAVVKKGKLNGLYEGTGQNIRWVLP